jgi:hypothetical protein
MSPNMPKLKTGAVDAPGRGDEPPEQPAVSRAAATIAIGRVIRRLTPPACLAPPSLARG